MHVRPSLTETTRSRSPRSAESTRLYGRRLVLARVVWVAVVVFTLSIFLASLPAYVGCFRGWRHRFFERLPGSCLLPSPCVSESANGTRNAGHAQT